MKQPLGYELRSTGIGLTGSSREVSFDRVDPGATASLAKLAGPVVGEAACGNGLRRVTFRDGLTAIFLGREFVGWRTAERQAGTAC